MEPKKREMTQKVTPKMPMTSDLTNYQNNTSVKPNRPDPQKLKVSQKGNYSQS